MIKEIKYSVYLESLNKYYALYKGKGSPTYTDNILDITTHKRISSILPKLVYHYRKVDDSFNKPRIVKITTEQMTTKFPMLFETHYELLSIEETYQLYREYVNKKVENIIKKNPNIHLSDIEKLPESVEHFIV